MLNDVLGALGFCVFFYILYVLLLKLFCGEWVWQAWKRKKKMEEELKQWVAEEKEMGNIK